MILSVIFHTSLILLTNDISYFIISLLFNLPWPSHTRISGKMSLSPLQKFCKQARKIKKVQKLSGGLSFYTFSQSQMEGWVWMALSSLSAQLLWWLEIIGNQQSCVVEIPLEKILNGFGCMCMNSTGLRPWGKLSFLKQSDTQVPFAGVGKSTSQSEHSHYPQRTICKCLWNYLCIYQSTIYLVSCPPPLFSHGFVELSVYPAEKRTIQSWFKV